MKVSTSAKSRAVGLRLFSWIYIPTGHFFKIIRDCGFYDSTLFLLHVKI